METSDGWMLIDLTSVNGCFVNGRRVREHHLRDGDLIAVGHHQLRFSGPQAKHARNGNGEATPIIAAGADTETMAVDPKADERLETPKPSFARSR
jgi:pSer/pThr/pTyr-binding forkhead associated (FHA) protein